MATSCITFEKKPIGVAVSGKSFYVKDELKALGGKWNPTMKAWIVATLTKGDQVALETAAVNAIREEKHTRNAERAAERAASKAGPKPLPQAGPKPLPQAGLKPLPNPLPWWICCDKVTFVDWEEQHVSCREHGFRVRGAFFTGD